MRFRNVFLLLGLIGLTIVVILNIHQLSSFVHLLSSLRWYVLVIVIIIQLISYYLNALYYRSILRVFDYYSIPTFKLFKGALAANFVNYILPSAGMAGAGIISQVLSPDVPRGKGVLVQIMRYGLSALAVLIMMPLGILIILLGHHGSRSVDRLAITTSLAILAVAGLIVGLVHQERWLRKRINWIKTRFSHRLAKFNTLSIDKFVDDFFIGYRTMIKSRRRMLVPFGWSIVYILVEISTLYLSFVALGKWVNPGIAIMAYAIANISSVIGGTFFSVGVFEVGMVGTMVALGQPFVFAFSVTLVYRIMNLIIGLPPGLLYYHQFLPKTKSRA